MKRIVTLACLLLWSIVVLACERQPSTPVSQPAVAIEKTVERGPVKLTVRLGNQRVNAGERIPTVIEVTAARDVDVTLPALGETLGPFDVLDPQSPPDIPVGELRRWTHRFALRTLDVGEQVVPPITIKFTDRRVTDGSSEPVESELSTPELTVTVNTSLAGDFDPSKFRDIKGEVAIDLPRGEWRWWWAVVAVGLTVVCWLVWRKLNQQSSIQMSIEPLLPPHVWAKRELDRLSSEGLVARGEIQPFFFRLSDIVRQYIERRFLIMAAEQTTEEFLREARRNPSLEQEQQRSLGEFLRGADMVKFARFQPDPSDCEAAMASARTFVTETAEALSPPASPKEAVA